MFLFLEIQFYYDIRIFRMGVIEIFELSVFCFYRNMILIRSFVSFYTGAMLYACSELEWMSSSLTLSAALLLGTICSAVDPVAVNFLFVMCLEGSVINLVFKYITCTYSVCLSVCLCPCVCLCLCLCVCVCNKIYYTFNLHHFH